MIRPLKTISSRVLSRHVLLPDRRVHASPEELGMWAEPLEARADGGVVLRGWRFRRREGEPGSSAAVPVLFLPGNSANLSAHLLYVELLVRAGCEVLAWDYGGYGRSGGRAALERLLDDARAIRDAALAALGNGARGGIGVFGVSIGANLALAIAAECEAIRTVAVEGLSIQREFVRGLLADGLPGPRGVLEVREDGRPVRLSRAFPLGTLRVPRVVAGPLAALAAATYPFAAKDPSQFAGDLDGRRLLVVHGLDDPLFPFEAAIRLFLAHRGPGALWLIPAVGHAQDPAFRVDDEYVAQLREHFGGGREAADEVSVTPCPAEGAGRWRVALAAGGLPGAFRVYALAGSVLALSRHWLEPGETCAVDAPERAEAVWATRLHRVERCDDRWEELVSQRARLLGGGVDARLDELAGLVRSGDVATACGRLRALDLECRPGPLDLLLRLYAARLEDLASRRFPDVAAEAREFFVRRGGVLAPEDGP